VAEIAQRFPPFYLPEDGDRSIEIMSYLRGQGYAATVAAEATARHMVANDP
jgi:hypothetical protein